MTRSCHVLGTDNSVEVEVGALTRGTWWLGHSQTALHAPSKARKHITYLALSPPNFWISGRTIILWDLGDWLDWDWMGVDDVLTSKFCRLSRCNHRFSWQNRLLFNNAEASGFFAMAILGFAGRPITLCGQELLMILVCLEENLALRNVIKRI